MKKKTWQNIKWSICEMTKTESNNTLKVGF